MHISSLPAPPAPAGRRRFRIIVGFVGLSVVSLLVLQYTPFHLLPDGKTDFLWGALSGCLAMVAMIEYRWTAAKYRD